jgi:hypothetical protein
MYSKLLYPFRHVSWTAGFQARLRDDADDPARDEVRSYYQGIANKSSNRKRGRGKTTGTVQIERSVTGEYNPNSSAARAARNASHPR